MNKIKITLPIIKINVEYSIRSTEKSGLFEYTILDIYQNFNNSEYQNYTFKDFLHKILLAKVPDLFIKKALEFLDNNRILTSKYEERLIELPISSFSVSDKKNLKNMLENKELYSQSQVKLMTLYYDLLINKIIEVDEHNLKDNIDKPFISGEQFKHINITDKTKSDFIKYIKKQDTSFYKDGAKVENIKEEPIIESDKKRKVLYRNVEIAFKFNYIQGNDYELILDKKFEFISRYKSQFINAIFENNDMVLEKLRDSHKFVKKIKKDTLGIVISDDENICNQINGNIFVIYSNENSKPIKLSDSKLKFRINQKYPWQIESYIIDGKVHYRKEINISDIKKDIKIIEYTNEIDDAYKKISNAVISNILEISFSKINHSDFYENIQYLNYLQFNSDEIRILLLEKIETLDINTMALKKIINITKYTKNILSEKDQLILIKKYLVNNDESIDDLIKMLADENIIIEKVALIQNDNFKTKNQPIKKVKTTTSSIKTKTEEAYSHKNKETSEQLKTKYVNNNLYEIRDQIVALVYRINKLEINYDNLNIFTITQESEKYNIALARISKDEQSFANFTSIMYKIVFERTKKDSKSLMMLPKEFRKDHAFITLLDTVRHIYAHDTSHEEWKTKMTEAEVLQKLKDNRVPPENSDFPNMQYKLLDYFKKYLEELYDSQKLKYLNKG